ncbi:mitogen-activated protein kinase kinase kinase 4 isoform X2 [Helicoverpa zea]|uniref:mitogen-activated protein kinase kinase kinase 4 isoform X2 n=1 Tax=Helicoverpa zea TaxID=7113 RepID=UPI001F55C26A|nr:mitogen-activated protein kinase kinase kinase 4 isoform X2 [Helicoverpa zea]
MGDSMDSDWKKSMGFPINYNSDSSDDDFDAKDVVFRNPRHSSKYLLADSGDGAEADLLGTTPPRSRIRDKERGRRNHLDAPGFQRLLRERKDVVDHQVHDPSSPMLDRLKKRCSLKLIRSRARDSKQDLTHDVRVDSLPSPNPMPAVPTLLHSQVESCSRFMSLTSRPKHREAIGHDTLLPDCEERWRCDGDEELPPSRVSFHKTFSLLINMGNIEKGCKRAISREEQVWQNELKDLIWLELQAKLAGRTLAQQDAYLCAQRNIVPKIINNIFEYKFVNKNPCRANSKRTLNFVTSQEDLTVHEEINEDGGDLEQMFGCLSFECAYCAAAVGRAMREVAALVDSFFNAVALYPSSRNMTVEHPQIATQMFKNRIKAMCLWYNMALHMRLKLVAMRRMLRSIRLKSQRRGAQHATSVDSSISRQSSETRPCQVRFNVSNPSDSSSSDCSGQSGGSVKEEPGECDEKDGEDGHKQEGEEGQDEKGTDDVDSGVDSKSIASTNGLPTPDISSAYKFGDPYTSNESGYMSSEGPPAANDAFDIGPLTELTHMRLLDKCKVSLYRDYHQEILKTQGVRRCMMFIYKMRMNLLDKVYLTLEKPETVTSENLIEEDGEEVFEDAANERPDSERQDEDEVKTYELSRYGCWSEECRSMRLPSYRSHFLLLSSLCMEAVHDYLSFRLEARPEHPSCLTVKQLIHELREGLDIASEMRADFALHVRAALGGRPPGPAARDLLLLTGTFDETVETLLKQYLSYLTTMSVTEHMPRSRLQAEWAFTAQLAKRIKCAAVLAPLTFSDITCNQLNRLLREFDDTIGKMMRHPEKDMAEPDKYTIYKVCRLAQSVYARSRDATLQAAQWARALAARLARAPPPSYTKQRADIFNSIMAIRDLITQHIEFILAKSRLSASDAELHRELSETVATRVRELLLQMFKLGFELNRELYKFVHAHRAGEERGLRRRPASLQPARPRRVERTRRPETMLVHESINPLIHKELHRLVSDTSRPAPPLAPPARPATPPGRRTRLLRSDSIVDEYENSVFDERLFDNIHHFGETQVQNSIELLLSGSADTPGEDEVELRRSSPTFPPGVERRVASCEEQRWAARVARGVIQFATCWMLFVVERCDRGRGLRPRWASQGLEFLMLACDPRNTKHLSEEEFEELKTLMDGCISHVIGSRPSPLSQHPRPAALPQPHSPRPRPRLQSPLPSNCSSREAPTPPTPPPVEADPLNYPEAESNAHRRRVLSAIEQVDSARDARLRDSKSVGHVLAAPLPSYEPKLRQLTFKWQRGLKIGAGTFGKVYTVVNTESGQLLAMKELSVGVGDRRALQRAANELRVLEGILHPHLVRYYGCELHREEMLLFMELCVEGSLEALVATSGALAEPTVRRYCGQLLSAVRELHARAIAHRDIKSGNIFLTNEGHCLKLGDFGCAVKIRANTTAPGELQGFVGTQAYMAPEVFMKSSGHGRAADIWSLGCVVTEMASGKRPFSQYDSNYQIMFLVGSGGRPEIPSTLSEEGQEFCMSCLTHDPDLRPRAETLTLHHFLMVRYWPDARDTIKRK